MRGACTICPNRCGHGSPPSSARARAWGTRSRASLGARGRRSRRRRPAGIARSTPITPRAIDPSRSGVPATPQRPSARRRRHRRLGPSRRRSTRSRVADDAALHLDREVRDSELRLDALAVVVRLARPCGDELHDARDAAGAELPEVQIGHARVAVRLEALVHGAHRVAARDHVEQLARRAAHERSSPPQDDEPPDDVHPRIEGVHAGIAVREQGSDRHDADASVNHDVEVRGPQVVIVRVAEVHDESRSPSRPRRSSSRTSPRARSRAVLVPRPISSLRESYGSRAPEPLTPRAIARSSLPSGA